MFQAATQPVEDGCNVFSSAGFVAIEATSYSAFSSSGTVLSLSQPVLCNVSNFLPAFAANPRKMLPVLLSVLVSNRVSAA